MEIRNNQKNLAFGTLLAQVPQGNRNWKAFENLEQKIASEIGTTGINLDTVNIDGAGTVFSARCKTLKQERTLGSILKNMGAKVVVVANNEFRKISEEFDRMVDQLVNHQQVEQLVDELNQLDK